MGRVAKSRGTRWLHALLYLGPCKPLLYRFGLLAMYGQWPRLVGRRRIPRHGPLVLAAAHRGPVDTFLLTATIPRPLRLLVGERMTRLPFVRAALKLSGAGTLWWSEATGYDERNAETLHHAADHVRAGNAVAIFPQGFRTSLGKGAVRVAVAAGAPVLPVSLHLRCAGTHRALIVADRPLEPEGRAARARRRLAARLQHRLGATAALWTDDETQTLLDVALDDRTLWKNPLRVIRRARRVQRLEPAAKRRLARRARAVSRGCRALGCRVEDLCDPPGVGTLVAYLALAPAALCGRLLRAPPKLLIRRLARPVADPIERRMARLSGGILMAVPWGICLAVAGAGLWGPAGILLPLIALAGIVADGVAKPLRRRLAASVRVARHGQRVRRWLVPSWDTAPAFSTRHGTPLAVSAQLDPACYSVVKDPAE